MSRQTRLQSTSGDDEGLDADARKFGTTRCGHDSRRDVVRNKMRTTYYAASRFYCAMLLHVPVPWLADIIQVLAPAKRRKQYPRNPSLVFAALAKLVMRKNAHISTLVHPIKHMTRCCALSHAFLAGYQWVTVKLRGMRPHQALRRHERDENSRSEIAAPKTGSRVESFHIDEHILKLDFDHVELAESYPNICSDICSDSEWEANDG